jgi:TonB family protein
MSQKGKQIKKQVMMSQTAKRIAHIVLLIFIISTGANLQSHATCANPSNENEADSVGTSSREIFYFVEESPMYPGGQEELINFFSQNLTYPSKAKEERVEGQVFVRFEVKEDGSIGEVIVSKSVHPSLDAEAIRVIKSMPKWLPGRFRGEAVNSWYTLPISFFLRK